MADTKSVRETENNRKSSQAHSFKQAYYGLYAYIDIQSIFISCVYTYIYTYLHIYIHIYICICLHATVWRGHMQVKMYTYCRQVPKREIPAGASDATLGERVPRSGDDRFFYGLL